MVVETARRVAKRFGQELRSTGPALMAAADHVEAEINAEKLSAAQRLDAGPRRTGTNGKSSPGPANGTSSVENETVVGDIGFPPTAVPAATPETRSSASPTSTESPTAA